MDARSQWEVLRKWRGWTEMINTQVEIETAEKQAVKELLSDGAEMRSILNILRVYASQYKGIVFAKGDLWHVKQVNGTVIRKDDGERLMFDSTAELFRWILFDAPDYRDAH